MLCDVLRVSRKTLLRLHKYELERQKGGLPDRCPYATALLRGEVVGLWLMWTVNDAVEMCAIARRIPIAEAASVVESIMAPRRKRWKTA